MQIYEYLKKDHLTVLKLLDDLIATEGKDVGTWKMLVKQIGDELIPHSRAEEAVFYNALRDEGEGKGLIGHAYREHVEAEALLRALQVSDFANVSWVNGAKKLRDALKHHIAEEEGKVFAAGREAFSVEEATEIGTAFAKLKPLVRDQSAMGQSMDAVLNLLPARLRKPLQKMAGGDAHAA